jgi:hypothetical protein
LSSQGGLPFIELQGKESEESEESEEEEYEHSTPLLLGCKPYIYIYILSFYMWLECW